MKWQWLDDYKEQLCTENTATFQGRKKRVTPSLPIVQS